MKQTVKDKKQKGLDVVGLMFSAPQRLKHVNRFATVFRLKEESVAEHCFFTAFYAMAICDWLEHGAHPKRFLSKGEVLSRCLLHDLEEGLSGDFPRPFKYSSSELKELLDQAGEFAMGRCCREMSPNEELNKLWFEKWFKAKDGSEEGRVVAVADYMSAVQYVVSEVQAGNKAIRGFLGGSLITYFEEFREPEYDFLRPILNEVENIMEEAEV